MVQARGGSAAFVLALHPVALGLWRAENATENAQAISISSFGRTGPPQELAPDQPCADGCPGIKGPVPPPVSMRDGQHTPEHGTSQQSVDYMRNTSRKHGGSADKKAPRAAGGGALCRSWRPVAGRRGVLSPASSARAEIVRGPSPWSSRKLWAASPSGLAASDGRGVPRASCQRHAAPVAG